MALRLLMQFSARNIVRNFVLDYNNVHPWEMRGEEGCSHFDYREYKSYFHFCKIISNFLRTESCGQVKSNNDEFTKPVFEDVLFTAEKERQLSLLLFPFDIIDDNADDLSFSEWQSTKASDSKLIQMNSQIVWFHFTVCLYNRYSPSCAADPRVFGFFLSLGWSFVYRMLLCCQNCSTRKKIQTRCSHEWQYRVWVWWWWTLCNTSGKAHCLPDKRVKSHVPLTSNYAGFDTWSI